MKSNSTKPRVRPRGEWIEKILKKRVQNWRKILIWKALLIVGFLLAQRLQSTKFRKSILAPMSTNENICRTISERPTEGGRKVPCIEKQLDKDSFFIPSNGKCGTHLPNTGFWAPTEWKVIDAMRSVFVKIFRFKAFALTDVFYIVQDEDKGVRSSFHHLRALDTSWTSPFFITCVISTKKLFNWQSPLWRHIFDLQFCDSSLSVVRDTSSPVTSAVQKNRVLGEEFQYSGSQASEMSSFYQLFGIYKEVCKTKLYFKRIFHRYINWQKKMFFKFKKIIIFFM